MSAFHLSAAESTEIANELAGKFPCFGGHRRAGDGNPIDAALAGQPLAFAAGVSVESVISTVLLAAERVLEKRYRFVIADNRGDGKGVVYWTRESGWVGAIGNASQFTAVDMESLKKLPIAGRPIRIDPATLKEV